MKKFLVIMFAFAFSSVAFAQEALAPEPSKDLVVKVCTTGYYNRENPRCATAEFLERRGDDLVFLVQPERLGGKDIKRELVLTSHLNTKARPYPPATYNPHSFLLQFPLKVGKKWSGTFDQKTLKGTYNRTRTAEVVGYGDLKLKAGVFKAYEIRAHNQWLLARNPAVEKYYYCPELFMICSEESAEHDYHQEVVEVIRK